MKLLITTPIFPPEVRGPATYVWNLSRKLAERGDQVVIITFTPSPQKLSGARIISVPQSGNFLTRQSRLFTAIFKEGKATDLIYSQGADVVGLASVVAGKLLHKKVVIKFVGDLSVELARDNNKMGFSLRLVELATWLALHLVNMIVFPAQHLQTSICKKYDLSKKKTAVIYNAIDD